MRGLEREKRTKRKKKNAFSNRKNAETLFLYLRIKIVPPPRARFVDQQNTLSHYYYLT